jgi:hypothetical protein
MTETVARGDRLQGPIALLGIGQLGLGLWMAVAPSTFYDALANFGPENAHDLRDVATFYLALGVVLLVAARRPSWRVPTLAFAGLQYGLHTINHLIDIGDSDPGWVGVFDFVSLGLFAAVLWALWRTAELEERA